MNELLPCPFCGWHTLNIQASSMFRVACPYCDMAGPLMSNKEAAIGTWNALPRALRWTKEPPTKPGWYLWREGNRGKVYVVILSTIEAARFHIKEDTCEWAGPIPEPKEK